MPVVDMLVVTSTGRELPDLHGRCSVLLGWQGGTERDPEMHGSHLLCVGELWCALGMCYPSCGM